MNTASIADLENGTKPESAWQRLTGAVGWPILCGGGAFVVGLLLMGAAAFYNHRARALTEARTPIAPETAAVSGVPSQAPPSELFLTQLPADATHLDDIGWIFKIAKEQGVNLGAVTYRAETTGAIPVVVRSMEVRVDEEYPKLKMFLAQMLRDLPHLSVDEIRIEQGNVPTGKLQATVHLSLIYRTDGP
jgi:hypothetical protein